MPAAVDGPATILTQPTDYYLDYTLKETLKQLNSLRKETVLPSDPQVLAAVLNRMSDGELAKAPNSEPVLLARLERKSLDPVQRENAVLELAKLHKTDRESELSDALQRVDTKGDAAVTAADDLGKLLLTSPAPALAKNRNRLAGLAEKARQPEVRRVAWAALVTVDGAPQTAWAAANNDTNRQALVEAIGLLFDPMIRARFQPSCFPPCWLTRRPRGDAFPRSKRVALMGPEMPGQLCHISRAPQSRAGANERRQRPDAASARQLVSGRAARPVAESISRMRKPSRPKNGPQDFVETVRLARSWRPSCPAPNECGISGRNCAVSV